MALLGHYISALLQMHGVGFPVKCVDVRVADNGTSTLENKSENVGTVAVIYKPAVDPNLEVGGRRGKGGELGKREV